jgi:hypothetical protein
VLQTKKYAVDLTQRKKKIELNLLCFVSVDIFVCSNPLSSVEEFNSESESETRTNLIYLSLT